MHMSGMVDIYEYVHVASVRFFLQNILIQFIDYSNPELNQGKHGGDRDPQNNLLNILI
jgi:hypothetical protein